MSDGWMWMVAVISLSLLGNWRVVLKRESGFVCWMVSDVAGIAHGIAGHDYWEAVFFAVLLGMAAWGWRRWRRHRWERRRVSGLTRGRGLAVYEVVEDGNVFHWVIAENFDDAICMVRKSIPDLELACLTANQKAPETILKFHCDNGKPIPLTADEWLRVYDYERRYLGCSEW